MHGLGLMCCAFLCMQSVLQLLFAMAQTPKPAHGVTGLMKSSKAAPRVEHMQAHYGWLSRKPHSSCKMQGLIIRWANFDSEAPESGPPSSVGKPPSEDCSHYSVFSKRQESSLTCQSIESGCFTTMHCGCVRRQQKLSCHQMDATVILLTCHHVTASTDTVLLVSA